MNHVFEPLCKKPRAVILDTDIGPDCDDVGALVCLIDYAKKYGFPILGICNCTSNKAGTGTIDAVCRHCGTEDRSYMNICFVMNDEYKELEPEFMKFATERGMVGIKGHRSVGGFRASCYNAMPLESVQALVDCMQEFEKLH